MESTSTAVIHPIAGTTTPARNLLWCSATEKSWVKAGLFQEQSRRAVSAYLCTGDMSKLRKKNVTSKRAKAVASEKKSART